MRQGMKTLKFLLIIIFIIVILIALGLLALGIWALVDRFNIATIMGLNLFSVAIVLIFISGILLLVTAVVGCLGTLREVQICIGISGFLFVGIFILLLAGGIMAFVFRDELGSSAKMNMKQSLVKDYGFVDEVTHAWDWVQEKIKCCGVEGNSTMAWGTYQAALSRWFREQEGAEFNNRVYVPKSCCRRVNRRYVNLERCQEYIRGPPGCIRCDTVFYNDALQYQGCYDAAVYAAVEQGVILGAVALCVVVFLLLGATFSFCLCRKISTQI